jgi:FkbM family methyltransferase
MTVRSRAGVVRRRAGEALAILSGRSGTGNGAARFSAPVPPSTADLDDVPDPTGMLAAIRRDQEDYANIRRLLAFSLAPDSFCIDVGANRGTILAEMQRVAPDGRHAAFEPLPHLSAFLKRTFPAVDVHEAALSDHAGTAEFSYFHGESEGWSGLKFRPLPTGEEAEVEQIEVRLEVLDDVIDPDRKLALIKVDVEGAEQQVFEGALATLRRNRPIIIFEHGVGSADQFGTEPADIHRLLSDEVGLRIFDLDGSGPYTLQEFEQCYFSAARVNFVARP